MRDLLHDFSAFEHACDHAHAFRSSARSHRSQAAVCGLCEPALASNPLQPDLSLFTHRGDLIRFAHTLMVPRMV
ncbi:hypothetical protein PENSPDRAFT_188354 [Peniophora sp. CONT]|nr:hypothetical protein PENSPDRAFT_188354 [Peniophora sp. CONT]